MINISVSESVILIADISVIRISVYLLIGASLVYSLNVNTSIYHDIRYDLRKRVAIQYHCLIYHDMVIYQCIVAFLMYTRLFTVSMSIRLPIKTCLCIQPHYTFRMKLQEVLNFL